MSIEIRTLTNPTFSSSNIEVNPKKISPQDKKISGIASSIFGKIKEFFLRLFGIKLAPPTKTNEEESQQLPENQQLQDASYVIILLNRLYQIDQKEIAEIKAEYEKSGHLGLYERNMLDPSTALGARVANLVFLQGRIEFLQEQQRMFEESQKTQ